MKEKTVWIVEHGSHYDDRPWTIEGVFATEKAADDFIESQGVFKRQYEKTEYELKGEPT